MKNLISCLICLAAVALAPLQVRADEDAKAEDKGKAGQKEGQQKDVETTEVEIKGGLTLEVPKAWEQSQPKSRLRLAQFSIPPVKGDEDAAELAIFNFGPGGGVKANIERWIGQFQADGRKVNVFQGAVEDGKYFFVNISGTYNKPIGPPIKRQTKPAPGSRMLGVILGVKDQGVYFLKMTGPDKTVAAQSDELRHAIGADAENENKVDAEKLR